MLFFGIQCHFSFRCKCKSLVLNLQYNKNQYMPHYVYLFAGVMVVTGEKMRLNSQATYLKTLSFSAAEARGRNR